MTCIACSVVIYFAIGWLISFVVMWWHPDETDTRPNKQESFFGILLLIALWPIWSIALAVIVLLALPVTLLHASVTGQWLWFWQDGPPEWDEVDNDDEYDDYEYFDPDDED